MTPSSSDSSGSRPALRHWISSAAQLSIVRWALALLICLIIFGQISGPRWHPVPYHPRLAPSTSDTTIGTSDMSGAPGSYPVTLHTTEVDTTGGVLRVSIYSPRIDSELGSTLPPPLEASPAVVFMHGAGTADYRRFEPHARALASAGITAVVPDKPQTEYSVAHRNYQAMARDYQAVAQWVRSLPDIGAVGYYAESEGAYIAPIVAADDPQTAFVVLVSAPVVAPRAQAAFAADSYLRNTFVPDNVFSIIPRGLGAAFPFGVLDYADFNVHPYQQQMTCPVFMTYGTADSSMPLIQGADETIRDLAVAGNAGISVRYYAGANHGMKIDGELVDAFLRDTARWINTLPGSATAAPKIAGVTPQQQFYALPPPAPSWYASGNMIVYGFLAGPLMLALGVGAGAIVSIGQWLARRRQGVRTFTTATWYLLRICVAATLAAIAAWVVHIAYLITIAQLAVNYQTSTIAVGGGWIASHATAVFAAGVAALALRETWHAYRACLSVALGPTLIMAGLTLSALCLLIVGAYWAMFAPLSLF